MTTDAQLSATIAELGTDERRVLLALARRLLAGQRTYGRLDVARDGRDWRRERADELADALVYGAIAEVAATLERSPSTMALDDDEPSVSDLVIVG
jgi:aryl-alcohol dehydrogenase-like predicted oxidoreductase